MTRQLIIILSLLVAGSGCKKYLDVPLPADRVAGSSVFQNDVTASGAINAIYGKMISGSIFEAVTGIGGTTGLYGDELKNWSPSQIILPLYTDATNSSDSYATGYWSNLYSQLYSANLAIEGLKTASNLNFQSQWLGEAYFTRALLYFYLTNLYGDVALVLSSDYVANNTLPRSQQANVYKQIIADLLQAQTLLDAKYHSTTGAVTTDRGLPNRAAATALLARAYLYTGDWKNAQAQADQLIGDAADYQLTALSNTFLLNNPEIIWGLEPYNTLGNPFIVKDALAFYIPAGKTPISVPVVATLSDSLVAAFEPGDARFASWVGKDTVPASGSTPLTVYYFAYKYKARGTYTAPQEMVTLFRLAEQFLIRAEAKARQNDLAGAAADLNTIRARAGLAPTTASTQSDLLAAILHERRVELFTESGHRFFDLRRTGNLDAVMSIIAPQKGGAWTSYKAWWPIPLSDVQNDLHLTQTPGYQ